MYICMPVALFGMRVARKFASFTHDRRLVDSEVKVTRDVCETTHCRRRPAVNFLQGRIDMMSLHVSNLFMSSSTHQ